MTLIRFGHIPGEYVSPHYLTGEEEEEEEPPTEGENLLNPQDEIGRMTSDDPPFGIDDG